MDRLEQRGRWRSRLRKLIDMYERVQVELHGKYSVERVAELHAYERSYATWQCVLVLLATPLPCLAIIVLTDLVPLRPPSNGFDNNTVLWVRVFFVAFAIAATLLEQGRRFVSELPLSTRALWIFSVVLGVCSTVYSYLLASIIGFPIPFTIILCAPCFCSTFGAIGYALWGAQLRENAQMRHDALAYIKIMVVQFSLTTIYPAYNFLFIQLTGIQQTMLALVLPLLKLIAKNAINAVFSKQLEDFKPEVVIFNVEVFHALFVSCCMQSSTSWTTTIALMGVDFIHAWSSLHDVQGQLRTIDAMEAKLRAAQAKIDAMRESLPDRSAARARFAASPQKTLLLIEKAMYYVHLDAGVRNNASIRLRTVGTTTVGGSVAVHPVTMTVDAARPAPIVPVDPPSQSRAADDNDNEAPSIPPSVATVRKSAPGFRSAGAKYDITDLVSGLHEDRHGSLAVLTTKERVDYVASILQVLYITEFVLLIEFVEVIIPVVYCVYLTAMFYLPNRVYYPQLAQMDSHSLLSTIGSALAYAALEFVSFVMLAVALRRKLQISPIHQLAFVVHTQWNLVQSKLILWVMFTVHISLEHFGYDYSFRFAWLRDP